MQVNKRELSEILGRSERTLTTWSKQGMPVEAASTRGRAHQFDTEAVIDWMIQREVSGLSNGGNLDLTEEQARLAHYRANVEKLKEDQLKGELIPAEIVILGGSGLVTSMRAKFLALHQKIKNRFPDLDQAIVDQIQRLIHEALTELGNDGLPPDIRERMRLVCERLEKSKTSEIDA